MPTTNKKEDLDKVQSKYVPQLLKKESKDGIEDRWIRIAERIFQLEKEDLCSRNTEIQSYTKKTGDTRASKGSILSQTLWSPS